MAIAPSYLLDTGPLILYARASKAGQAIEARYQFQSTAFKPLLCVVSVGELHAFALRNSWGPKRQAQLSNLLTNTVRLSIDDPDVITSYAEIETFCHRHGWSLGDNDLWIAAMANVTRATLVTTDRDFDPLAPDFLHRVYVDPKTGEIEE